MSAIVCFSTIKFSGNPNIRFLAEFDVDNVGPIRWSKDAFSRLVLPHGYKEIIRAFVQEQLARDDKFDDIVYGKGEHKYPNSRMIGTPGSG